MTAYAQRLREVMRKLDESLSLLSRMVHDQRARATSKSTEADKLRYLVRDHDLLNDVRSRLQVAIQGLDMDDLCYELGSLAGALGHLDSNFSVFTAGAAFEKVAGALSNESLLLKKDLRDPANQAALRSELAPRP